MAWRRLVDLYSPLTFAWCRRCGVGEEDANDVVQEVFVKVATKLSSFRRERPGDTFRGWLRVIARNEIRMHFRRKSAKEEAAGGSTANLRIQEIADEALDESEDVVSEEEAQLYHRALRLIRSDFEERTWRAFIQTTIDGRSTADVAAELQITAGAVRQAKYKVLRRLRAEFGDLVE